MNYTVNRRVSEFLGRLGDAPHFYYHSFSETHRVFAAYEGSRIFVFKLYKNFTLCDIKIFIYKNRLDLKIGQVFANFR
jgi:hypothetical protein